MGVGSGATGDGGEGAAGAWGAVSELAGGEGKVVHELRRDFLSPLFLPPPPPLLRPCAPPPPRPDPLPRPDRPGEAGLPGAGAGADACRRRAGPAAEWKA